MKFLFLTKIILISLLIFVTSDSLARNKIVHIVNRSDQIVKAIYKINKDKTVKPINLLGRNPLKINRSIDIDFDDGTGQCYFDVKVVFKSRKFTVAENINVCEIADLYVE